MSLIDLLDNDIYWKDFINHKIKNSLSKKETKEYKILKDNKKVKAIINDLKNDNYTFTLPRKTIINKIRKNKKRVVYQFTKEETYILKYITYLLYEYDYLFSKNLYSFRQNISVKNAINDIKKYKINDNYNYKVDIKNYFNSINIDKILKELKQDIEEETYNLIKDILLNKSVTYKNEIFEEEKGIMAGVPISSFLANYYLKDLDKYFEREEIIYFRYADDILISAKSKKDLDKYIKIIKKELKKKNLEINQEKEYYYNPNTPIEFLGFSISDQEIDISSNSIRKIKGKIKRSSRSIRRWMLKKNIKVEPTIKTMTKKFNKKLLGKEENELSWKYWYFNVITTTKSLKIIDDYMQQELRYLITGKHNKKNYEKVPYELLKKCGYKSLINEYYNFKDKNK